MEREYAFILLILVAIVNAGCGSGGDGEPAGTPALSPLSVMPHYAVVSSDFSSSSIAVFDESFELIDPSWVNSGTTYPGLVATLSGDAVLPTRQAGDGTLAMIDRLNTDVVTRFFVPSGNLNGQVRTQGERGPSGYSSNPQDLIFVDSNSAWAPRYETNLDPDAPADSRGNDLFEIDPIDMTATGARIDLSVLNTLARVPGTDDEVEVLARPSRGALVDSAIVVGLDRMSANFDAAGPGMVARVDLDDESILGIELDGMQNCGRVVPIPGASNEVAVACVGFSNPFNDEPQLRATSGIAVLSFREGGATIEHVWRVADGGDAPRAVNALLALDGERMLAVASGNFADTTDTLYEIDLSTGELEPVLVSTGSFTIGVSAWDPDSEMLYVPDAATNTVRELAYDGEGFVEIGATEIPGPSLPPTQVYLLN